MYCPNCKNKVLENTAVCHFCGYDLTKLRNVDLDDSMDDDSAWDDRTLHKKKYQDALSYDPFKEKLRYHMGGVAGLLIIGLLLVCVSYFTGHFMEGFLWSMITVVGLIMTFAGMIYGVVCIILFFR